METMQISKVDLSNCDKEPIHLVGKIQPHGAIIVAAKDTRKIEQASVNAGNFIDMQTGRLLGANLDDVLGFDCLLNNPVTAKGSVYIAHESEDKIVLEIERVPGDANDSALNELQLLSDYIKELNEQGSIPPAAVILASTVQRYTDYDRVMIYKFDEEWNGGVIAEKVKPGIESYNNHHFPASDIPAQARQMLLKKVSRQIPDSSCTAVDLLSADGCERDVPIDLLLSELRYPSEMHLEFLRNMNVKASLTTSIIVKEKLWGIIACQHQEELNIHYPQRRICELMSRYFSSFVEGVKEKVDKDEMDFYEYNKTELLKTIEYYEGLGPGFTNSTESLMKVTSGHGVAVIHEGLVATYGKVPSKKEILALADWLAENKITETFHTHNLGRFYPEGSVIEEVASGILAIAIHPESKEYIIWFKPGITVTRVWAGDPNKPVDIESGKIHPRRSFENWKEIVKGKSHEWTLSEITVTNELRQSLTNLKISYQNKKLLTTIADLTSAQQDLKESNRKLQSANKDLEGFAYTVSHDLRSPLTSVIGATGLLLTSMSDKLDQDVKRFVQITHDQAQKMNDLVQEVLNYAKAGLVWSQKQEVDLNKIVAGIRQDLSLPSHIQLSTEHLPVVKYNKVQLTQVMQNLIDNARKYNDKATGTIVIRAKEKPREWEISVADNGKGIEEKMFPKVFEVFGTAHGEDRKDSIGIGLAIVKKIIETNGGRIAFTSKVGEGTTFTFTIPK